MKKWIRWQGLGAFLGAVIIVFVFWYLFIDSIVERGIETLGTKAVGAKVELESADLSLFPAGLRLTRLQVTNPDEPMKNAVEISRANLSLETARLLQRKIIINEMTLQGIQLNTTRKTSGALTSREPAVTKEPEKELPGKISMPTLEIPNVAEILKKEGLESLKLTESLQEDIRTEKDKWKESLKDLPDKEKFNTYRDRIQKLKSAAKKPLAGLLGAVGDAAAIKKDIQSDLERIKQARQDFDRTIASLKEKLDQAAKAPLKDVDRLKKKYSLSAQGMANMTALLFGSKINYWIQKAVIWHARLKPIIEGTRKKQKDSGPAKPVRGKGVFIRFKEKNPLPDFLIRAMNAQLQLKAGDLAGTIKNVTSRQDILGIPLTFLFSGEKMKELNSLNLKGTLDHIIASQPKDTASLSIQGFKARDIPFNETGGFPITLNNADVDLKLDALLRGDTIEANLTSELRSVRLSTGARDTAGSLTDIIASALSDVSGFKLTADIAGTLDEYTVSLGSDLDSVLKAAVGKAVGRQAAQLEKDLKIAIASKVNGPLNKVRDGLGGLGAIDGELANRNNLGKELLKNLQLPF